MSRTILTAAAATVAAAAASLVAIGPIALGGTLLATGSSPPGGPAPKALVGRYHAKFTLDEYRNAPQPRFLNAAKVEELVILNAQPGSPQGIGLHGVGAARR
jgi:hypothetical protein